jgi:ubiquinone/menaquinone biosynthesis C-methylase UbiE
MNGSHLLILYTTRYRRGGDRFALAARTMEREMRATHPELAVVRRAVESKREFVEAFREIERSGGLVAELHFIGHSGMYGIMFGTTDWPEQFSPHEWRTLSLPFAAGAHCWFHACRSGRWFAPFFARTFGVTAHGHHWYTTVSREKERFVRQRGRDDDPTYIISCPGRKSHGVLGSVYKYLGNARALPMHEFAPTETDIDTSYDAVAELYDRTFDDIAVRRDEHRWLMRNLDTARRVDLLDIGCGTGAFLSRLAPVIERGVGVDTSARMLEHAVARCADASNLSFVQITGPDLPFADASFDVVLSVLSFRYLDWDPIVREILRVLRRGGELLVIDMVAAPVRARDLPALVVGKAKAYLQRLTRAEYVRALRAMVGDPRWKRMLTYNPIRAEHELRWYLESRFPGRRVEVINVGWSSRILAFRSGPIHAEQVPPLQYP